MTNTIIIADLSNSDTLKVTQILTALNMNYTTTSTNPSISLSTPVRSRSRSWRYISDLGLQAGDVIRFVGNCNITATIVGDKKVEFNGKQMSLSRATILVKNTREHGFSGRNFWTFNGETLMRRGKRMGL